MNYFKNMSSKLLIAGFALMVAACGNSPADKNENGSADMEKVAAYKGDTE